MRLLLLVILLAGCDKRDFQTDEEIARFAKRDLREYKETSLGIHYFITCVEGYKFIATHSAYSNISLAGPIGECNEN